MSHEFETGFFTKQAAWHRLGTVLDQPPTIEQGLIEAGLDWQVKLEEIYCRNGNPSGWGDSIPIKTHKAVIRESDSSVLGIVSDRYKPLSNKQAFEFFAPLVEDGTVELEAAGSLMEGKKVWVLAKYAQNVEIKEGDELLPYLLLATGHDGKLSITCKNTPVRVVCWNTMQAAGVSEDGKMDMSDAVSIQHTGNMAAKLSAARESVLLARKQLGETATIYQAMSKKLVDVQTVRDFAKEVFDPDYIKAKELIKKLEVRVQQEEGMLKHELHAKMVEMQELLSKPSLVESKIVQSFEEGPGADIAGSTLWGLFNAATDHIDHTRSRGEEAGLASSWFGAGSQLRKKAMQEATALL